MFFDGIQIYQFHQNDKNVVTCTDNQNGFLRVPPIHTGLGDGGYVFVPIEFAGVTTAILSYVRKTFRIEAFCVRCFYLHDSLNSLPTFLATRSFCVANAF